jgi:hypothetical protein
MTALWISASRPPQTSLSQDCLSQARLTHMSLGVISRPPLHYEMPGKNPG